MSPAVDGPLNQLFIIFHTCCRYVNLHGAEACSITSTQLQGPQFNSEGGGYSLCGAFYVLPMSLWVSSVFFSFFPPSRKHAYSVNVYVNVCAHGSLNWNGILCRVQLFLL